MRDDMDKVIVERPRPGSSRHVPRRMRRLDPRRIAVSEDEDDPFPPRIGHKRAAGLCGQRKRLNENLAPLRRYLDKQAGRPWDEVWSEICAGISVDNAVQKHVRDHVGDFVSISTLRIDGELHMNARWGGLRPLERRSWLRLYVDPDTGVLCRIPEGRSHRARSRRQKVEEDARAAARMRVLAHNRQLHLLSDGNWWEVELVETRSAALSHLPSAVPHPSPIEDVIDRAGMSDLPREERYRRSGMHAVAKRALSRRELRALGLRAA